MGTAQSLRTSSLSLPGMNRIDEIVRGVGLLPGMLNVADARLISILGLLALSVVALLLPGFPQDPNYHRFAAEYSFYGIPNFWNVISNLAFAVVAFFAWSDRKRATGAIAEVFRIGVFLTAFGSAFYHWTPTNDRLFWDRLPMTIAFSGVICAVISACRDDGLGGFLLWPILLLSCCSVVYWRWTEGQGHGNLTPYGIVQFGTVALILGTLVFSRRQTLERRPLWWAAGAYLTAKLLEGFDRQVAGVLRIMGGHPIKHLAAALACWWLHIALFRRRAGTKAEI